MIDPVAILAQQSQELGSQKALADKIGCSQQHLNDVIRGRKAPGRTLLEYLGLKRVVTYLPDLDVLDESTKH